MQICVPESKIEWVSVERGAYYVRYFSGRNRKFKDPPRSVREFMAKTPVREHWSFAYNGDNWETDLYRNYLEGDVENA